MLERLSVVAAPGSYEITRMVQIFERAEGVGRLFEGPASRGTKLEDCHALMGAVMRPSLRRDLRYAELFVHQGARFVESVVLRRESHPRIDAIGSQGTRVDDGVVGQCDGMEYRRLNAVLPALGKMDLRWLRIGEHRGLRKRVLESFLLKDAIRAIYSGCYGPDGEPKDSVDHRTPSTGVICPPSLSCTSLHRDLLCPTEIIFTTPEFRDGVDMDELRRFH